MHLLTKPAREAWNPSRAGKKGLSGQTCTKWPGKEEGIPITLVTPVDSRLEEPCMVTIPNFCPLKFNSPLHKKNAEAALMRLHRGCEGYDNGLVNYLCALFFLLFFWQSW